MFQYYFIARHSLNLSSSVRHKAAEGLDRAHLVNAVPHKTTKIKRTRSDHDENANTFGEPICDVALYTYKQLPGYFVKVPQISLTLPHVGNEVKVTILFRSAI